MAKTNGVGFVRGSLLVATTVLALVLVVFVVMETRNSAREYDYIGRSAEQDNTITISGTAKQVVVPDVVKLSVGVFTISPQVPAAQQENTQKMNEVIAAIKGLGIEDKDIKTTYYHINPEYDFRDGRSVVVGYRVSQAVDLTIRQVDRSSQVLSVAVERGANEVGSLRFEVDDIEDVKQTARLEALGNAKEKAAAMAEALGVKLGRITGFAEDSFSPPFFGRESMGFGGDTAAFPSIEPGVNEVEATVYVTFEIL